MTAPHIDADLVRRLDEAAPGRVTVGIDLSQLTRWGIGGKADALVEPADEHQISAVLALLKATGTRYCVVGETSNLLFDSEGVRGVIIRIASQLAGIEIDGLNVIVRAGTSVPELARAVGQRGLSGIEHTVGIPGTIGGLVLMNGGSQRKGIGSHVVWVKYVDEDGTIREFTQQECEFSYRSSSLQRQSGVVVEVGMRLANGNTEQIIAEMDEIVASRSARFPEDEANCGSTFLSDPGMYSTVGPPGRAIEEAGLIGKQIGGAQVSLKHANFINNVGGATSDDVLALIGLIRDTVRLRTGFSMNAEARYVLPNARMVPAHEESDRRSAVSEVHTKLGE